MAPNLGSFAKAVPALDPEAWTKVMQGGPTAVPGMMGEYLEKSASNVIGMQEELRKQAMQMFSTFPYNPLATAGDKASAATSGDNSSESAAEERKPPRAKPKAKKSGRA